MKRPRAGTVIVLAAAVCAVAGVLKNHTRRAATPAAAQSAVLVEDAWSEALADPSAATAPGVPADALDAFVLSDLQFVIDELRALIADGRERCDALGEPAYEPGLGGREAERRVAAWRAFAAEWNARLDDAGASLPGAPDLDDQPEASLAYQDIGRAIQELRLVPVGAGEWPTPFESLWSSRFDTAAGLLDAAAARLDPATPRP